MTDTTARGWQIQPTTANLVRFPWVTGHVMAGDVETIFDFLCARFNHAVEPIIKSQSWGWSYRPVRGTEAAPVWSEHAAAMAIDLNAPAHPLGVKDTFTAAQQATIRQIVDRELAGVVAWGGEWTRRPDDMHFEIRNQPSEIARLAALIRQQRGDATPAAQPAAPANSIGTRQTASITEWLTQQGRDASFAARAVLAKQYGIEGYVGSAEQNLRLLSILRSGTTGKRYVATTDVNRRVAPPTTEGALAEVSRFGELPAGMAWTGTGRTATDVRGHVWIEGRSDWMISTGQDAEWINSAYLKEA